MVRFDCPWNGCTLHHCHECGHHKLPNEACETCALAKTPLDKRALDVIETERAKTVQTWEGIVATSQGNRYLPVYEEALRNHREMMPQELIENAHPSYCTYRHRLKEMMHNERHCAQAED